MNCRHCSSHLSKIFLDLGSAPPSNAYLTSSALKSAEKWYPLKVMVCEECWLVQTEDSALAKDFFDDEYAYFSSFSTSWLEHANKYVAMISERFNLGKKSNVIEVAANDGYLLQYVKALGIGCLGIEPTLSTANAARQKGIEIIEDFFGVKLAEKLVQQGLSADITVANNVLAHVPDINDFVSGFRILLKPNGVATFEFPHLMKLVAHNQFDTIYHEHYSYLSLSSVHRIFNENGLSIFDVEELSTHGGSLRIFCQRKNSGKYAVTENVSELLALENSAGICSKTYYAGMQKEANRVKNEFNSFLIESVRNGKSVGAYGAAAKGNTLINYSGVRPDLLPFVVDRNPAKQGKFLPGSRIPIVDENHLCQAKPDYVIILPWNLSTEVIEQLAYIRDWGGKFVTFIPKMKIHF
jgi:SAM-dependent methyltransferase